MFGLGGRRGAGGVEAGEELGEGGRDEGNRDAWAEEQWWAHCEERYAAVVAVVFAGEDTHIVEDAFVSLSRG